MRLAETVRQKLAENFPHSGRHELAIADDKAGWAINLTLDRRDELGCLLWELALRRTNPAPAGETLRTWAERIARQTTGLLEPLKVHEIDELRNEALLRSEAPSLRKGKRLYYEVLLRGTNLAWLRRYEADANGNGKREQVAFALTNDGLAKLADDLTAVR
jgi:hypothetical protein